MSTHVPSTNSSLSRLFYYLSFRCYKFWRCSFISIKFNSENRTSTKTTKTDHHHSPQMRRKLLSIHTDSIRLHSAPASRIWVRASYQVPLYHNFKHTAHYLIQLNRIINTRTRNVLPRAGNVHYSIVALSAGERNSCEQMLPTDATE